MRKKSGVYSKIDSASVSQSQKYSPMILSARYWSSFPPIQHQYGVGVMYPLLMLEPMMA
jgi:hypothetical protein